MNIRNYSFKYILNNRNNWKTGEAFFIEKNIEYRKVIVPADQNFALQQVIYKYMKMFLVSLFIYRKSMIKDIQLNYGMYCANMKMTNCNVSS